MEKQVTSDISSLVWFMGILIAFNLFSHYLLPLWGTAMYGAWLAVGVAVVVQAGVEPGLPRGFGGNFRRILRGHLWPLYVI